MHGYKQRYALSHSTLVTIHSSKSMLFYYLFIVSLRKGSTRKKKQKKTNETCCVYIAKENANNASRKLISIQLYPGKIINDHS